MMTKRSEIPPTEKRSRKLAGTVDIVPPVMPGEPEQAQITVEGAAPLYGEIRVSNVLKDESGETVALKPGSHVDVTIEAEPESTKPTKLHGKH